MKNQKIIIAHPGKQHSYYSANALVSNGFNVTYITTVYNKEGSWTRKLKSIFLKGDNLIRANSRKCDWLDDDQVKQFCELSSLVTLLLLRIDKNKKIYRVWNNLVFRRFGIKVAKYAIKNKCNAVIMYDANAKSCFEYLKKKKSSIIKILDVSIASRPYQKYVYEEDIRKTGLIGLKDEQVFLWKQKYQEYYKKEIALSDYFICPSEFVKKSLLYSGASENRIYKVPYGVQLDKFTYCERKIEQGPLHLVMAGQVNYRKGIHHILNVLKNYSPEEVKLVLFGSLNRTDPYIANNCNIPTIEYRGFVTQDKIIEEYKKSDAYLFPSMCEGLSLSVLEAMSSGLPVIVSDHSGANDLIKDGVNGMVFTAGNDEELKRVINWFIHNKNKLKEMGHNARATATIYSWDNYSMNYSNAVKKIVYKR